MSKHRSSSCKHWLYFEKSGIGQAKAARPTTSEHYCSIRGVTLKHWSNSSRGSPYHRELGDRAGEGSTLNDIGLVILNQGRYAEALKQFQQVLAIRQEIGDRVGEAGSLNDVGLVYFYQDRYAEALEQFQQSLAIRREIGDRAGEGTTLNNIGSVYDAEGRNTEALEQFPEGAGHTSRSRRSGRRRCHIE